MAQTIRNGSYVLVVDDEPMVREVVARYLEREGFRVRTAGRGDVAIEILRDDPPDLLVLDVMLPEVGGLEILGSLAEKHPPVILLSARTDEADRVVGLELGADDYVTKPFSPRELSARVKSVLRRSRKKPDPDATPLAYAGLEIDPRSREVRHNGRLIELTRREFELLAFMATSPRQVFSRSQLLEHVWDSSPDWQDPSTVTVHIRRLRNKLENDPEKPRWITTVWGVGYRFEP